MSTLHTGRGAKLFDQDALAVGTANSEVFTVDPNLGKVAVQVFLESTSSPVGTVQMYGACGPDMPLVPVGSTLSLATLDGATPKSDFIFLYNGAFPNYLQIRVIVGSGTAVITAVAVGGQ